MNRPDFLIRTLSYYAKLQSPHPIYIGDSSNPENIRIIKTFIESLKNKLEIDYNWFPPGFDNLEKLLSRVKEKYVAVNGDDDYQIPSSLTNCADFLEDSPDYASAGGYGVTFRLKTSGPYGEIARLADYPRYSLEADTASQRLLDFMKDCFTITFAVNRISHMRKIFVGPIPLASTWNELSEICYCAVAGKSKLVDCLGIVRHIHDRQYNAPAIMDWLTSSDFHSSYISLNKLLAGKISETDNIPLDKAEGVVKNAFWEFLQVYMAREKRASVGMNQPKNGYFLKTLRSNIGTTFPILKTAYRRYLKPFISEKQQLHYEVTNPRSPYYKDFQAVVDSFTGKDINIKT